MQNSYKKLVKKIFEGNTIIISGKLCPKKPYFKDFFYAKTTVFFLKSDISYCKKLQKNAKENITNI